MGSDLSASCAVSPTRPQPLPSATPSTGGDKSKLRTQQQFGKRFWPCSLYIGYRVQLKLDPDVNRDSQRQHPRAMGVSPADGRSSRTEGPQNGRTFRNSWWELTDPAVPKTKQTGDPPRPYKSIYLRWGQEGQEAYLNHKNWSTEYVIQCPNPQPPDWPELFQWTEDLNAPQSVTVKCHSEVWWLFFLAFSRGLRRFIRTLLTEAGGVAYWALECLSLANPDSQKPWTSWGPISHRGVNGGQRKSQVLTQVSLRVSPRDTRLTPWLFSIFWVCV